MNWTPRTTTQEELGIIKQSVDINYETGAIFWKERPRSFFNSDRAWRISNTRCTGNRADTPTSDGYRRVRILTTPFRAHRLIWEQKYGIIAPGFFIDHINGDRCDNGIENLRLVTKAENHRNMKTPKNNTSGVVGVKWDNVPKKWRADITFHGKIYHLGSYDNIEEAARARKSGEKKFGFHENHGRMV